MISPAQALKPNAIKLEETPLVGRRPAEVADIVDLRDPVERLQQLSDGRVLEILHASDGAVSGIGLLGDTECVLFATDPRRSGGALGVEGCETIVTAYRAALERDVPIVGVWQSGGARLPEGAAGLNAVGSIFAAMTRASGIVPQVSIVLGAAAGGAAYGPALTDVVIVGPDARVFVTGPDIVSRVTGETIDAESLGGPQVHAKSSGLSHIRAKSDADAFQQARDVVSLLGNNKLPVPQELGTEPNNPSDLMPENLRRAYDVRPIINSLLDAAPTELQREWAPNVVTSLGRLGGQPVGVIANNPIRMGGCLTAPASEKAARFVRLCDSFGLPLVVVVDVPGYLPGSKQENEGIVRRGAKLLHAFAAADVPRFTIITRKAYGGAYIAMNSRALGASKVLAWPTAVVDVMSPQSAVQITRRRDIARVPAHGRDDAIETFAAEHSALTGGLERAVSEGLVDEVIDPASTRSLLVSLIEESTITRSRRKNIPL
ncbi:MAG: acetyl-CoA/propionyl-CoA carboxylase carboxyl transferase subunit [Actinomycetes bacterium]|jgi:acetyl-CoA/propionyl-CoA carboxylase carboxyl transferase subunit